MVLNKILFKNVCCLKKKKIPNKIISIKLSIAQLPFYSLCFWGIFYWANTERNTYFLTTVQMLTYK